MKYFVISLRARPDLTTIKASFTDDKATPKPRKLLKQSLLGKINFHMTISQLPSNIFKQFKSLNEAFPWEGKEPQIGFKQIQTSKVLSYLKWHLKCRNVISIVAGRGKGNISANRNKYNRPI